VHAARPVFHTTTTLSAHMRSRVEHGAFMARYGNVTRTEWWEMDLADAYEELQIVCDLKMKEREPDTP